MRTDGSSFITRLEATAGLTYKFNATLQQAGGSFLRCVRPGRPNLRCKGV